MATQNKNVRFGILSPRGTFDFALSGIIDMDRVVRRINAADFQSVAETALLIKQETVRHLYMTWKEQSGAAGRSVQVIEAGHSGSSFRQTKVKGQSYGTGGYTAQVGSVYEAGNFQRGINHFVLLEGGFTLRDGRFKKGGHSLALASQFFAGNLPKSWVRHWNSDSR